MRAVLAEKSRSLGVPGRKEAVRNIVEAQYMESGSMLAAAKGKTEFGFGPLGVLVSKVCTQAERTIGAGM